MEHSLVILAAGLASRYGRLKQLEPVGPHGAALMDYAIYDARRAGFRKIVLVVAPGLQSTFEEHLREVFDGSLSASYLTQEIGAVPPGFRVPHDRRKPWGTAHAVLAAAPELGGPFAVINADDFYGASSYRILHQQLLSDRHAAALVGFELVETLSPHGGVSRGICEQDERGFLTRLIEVKQIEDRGGRIVGTDTSGAAVTLRGDETASMNMWGLTPAVLEALRGQFAEFLASEGSEPRAEFLLSTAVGHLVTTGRMRLRVLASRERWFGMTFAADTPAVIARIADLVARGEYPEHLSRGLP